VKVLGVIPARIGATRFPGKPLALLLGRPLVLHVLDRARECAALDRVVVATDSAEIERVVVEGGGEAMRTRADHESGTDRVAEVAERLPEYGAVINLQGDEPTLDPRAIAAAVLPIVRGEAVLATLAHQETDPEAFASPDVVKVLVDSDGFARTFTREPLPEALDEGAFLRHVGLYAFERGTLLRFAALPPTERERTARLEQLRALDHGIKIRVVVTPWRSRGVDTPADLAALESHGEQEPLR
jgi:3-deoxy-manno-octulosonate cytidylyltransferase (CMP-KDO synthetase)